MNSKSRSLSKGSMKVMLSWPEYISMVNELIKKISSSKIKFSRVYGPARGGVIPAVLISHCLKKEYVDEIGFHNNFGNKHMLIVDDIIDSSETMKSLVNHCKMYKTRFWTASLFKHKDSPFTPDFYIKEINQWVSFPYEKISIWI